MSQAETLYHLQEIDLKLVQLNKRLNEIQAALSGNVTVQAAQQGVKAAQQTLTPLQTKVKNLELEIQTNAEKIRATDEALYGGKVRNPKELQEMQNEIQSLKKRNVELEDLLLETMEKAETAEAALAENQTVFQQAESEWTQAHQQLLDEKSQLESERVSYQKKRGDALPGIAADLLKTYESMRPRKNNQPVALLVNQSCSVCRVEQDLSIVNEARRGQKLTTCLSCGRILVYRSG